MAILDDLKKRLALAARKPAPQVPVPGRVLSDSMLDAAEKVDRDYNWVSPRAPALAAKPQTMAEAVEAFRERFRGEHPLIEKLKGMVPEKQVWTAPNGTAYYIEPEGNYMMIQPKGGELDSILLSDLKKIEDLHTDQMKKEGVPDTFQAPPKIEISEGQRQAEATNKALFKRINVALNQKVYNALEKIYAEGLSSRNPEKQGLPVGLDADKGRGEMVLVIAQYGREEGKNMVRELRDHGGEIVHKSLTYSVDGETFTRTHTPSLKFDFPAKEVEQAIDTRQAELAAIDRYEQSPARALQERLAAEAGKAREPAVSVATAEETLSAFDHLNDDKRILDEATHARDEARDLGQEVAAFGKDRESDLISELRENGGQVEYNGATYSLEGSNLGNSEVLVCTKDGKTTEHDAYAVEDGIEHRRQEERLAEEAVMSPYERLEAGLSRPPEVSEEQWETLQKKYQHDLMMENTPDEFIPGTEAYYREHGEHAVEGHDTERQVEQGQIEEPKGFRLNESEEAPQAPDFEDRIDDSLDLEYARSTTPDQAAAPAQQPTEADLKAQIAALQEQLASFQQSHAPQEIEQEKALERQQDQTNLNASQQPAEKTDRRELANDRQVADVIEGRSQSDDWSSVGARRLQAKREAGEEVSEKPYVARARASEEAAARTMERQQTHQSSQSLH